MKYGILFPFLVLACISGNVCQAKAEQRINLVCELGAGEFAYLGGEYHFPALPAIPIDSVGIVCGYSFLNEDAAHVIEPAFYISGSLVQDITWRVKGSKLLVTSFEYQVSGQAWSGGLDVLWKFTSWAFVDLSLPYVAGEKGNAWTPCIGVGAIYPLWEKK